MTGRKGSLSIGKSHSPGLWVKLATIDGFVEVCGAGAIRVDATGVLMMILLVGKGWPWGCVRSQQQSCFSHAAGILINGLL
jgi:hypothetical protein